MKNILNAKQKGLCIEQNGLKNLSKKDIKTLQDDTESFLESLEVFLKYVNKQNKKLVKGDH